MVIVGMTTDLWMANCKKRSDATFTLQFCANDFCMHDVTLQTVVMPVFYKLCRRAESLGAHKTISVSTHHKVTAAVSSTGSDQKSETSRYYCPTMNKHVFVSQTFCLIKVTSVIVTIVVCSESVDLASVLLTLTNDIHGDCC